MNSKSMFGMTLMMGAMLSASGDNNTRRNEAINRLGESVEERKNRLADAKIKQNIAKGLKEFHYPKASIWALNQKSADKKANKLNLI